MYWWLPVAWILRHPFDSAARAPGIKAPVLILTGTTDTLIPNKHSERLAKVWGGPVERVSFEGFGHNDLDLNPRYPAAIQDFLARCL
jgi:pimeloyl-ACP methyl ester carboxylesterase